MAYARVSSHDQKFNLENQIRALKSRAPGAEVYADIRSGLNLKRKGLLRLLDDVVGRKISKVYVSPRGTSSECPVCGGKLEHPTWAVSRCRTCGVNYDRDRLASLAILCRGVRLCGQPFAVSADASRRRLRDEYLHPLGRPDAERAGWTNAASALNLGMYTKAHV